MLIIPDWQREFLAYGIIGRMIANISITEKSFGSKVLMTGVKFGVDDGEKVGLVGRNGVGKSTLFGMLAGTDSDYNGSIIFRRGSVVVATAQEHHGLDNITVLEYILRGLPEYVRLRHILTTYPATMGDDMRKIEEYSQALDRFGQKGFYRIEELVAEELKNFQMKGFGERQLASLSGGQKRLVEVVKIMHAQADLALIDEPTNHMDYIAKKQFIDWMKNVHQAMLVITHDRDVLAEVDRIVELRDGMAVSYRGNYDDYLRQNASATGNAMHDYEQIERRIANLRDKVVQFRRMKEKARDPDTIKQFKRRENQAAAELEELEKIDKPTFWIDSDNVAQLNYKVADRYQKFKARNIRLDVQDGSMRSQRKLVEVRDLALGFGEQILFEGVNIDLREGEAVELRGRNGAGKTTLIRELLDVQVANRDTARLTPVVYTGLLHLDPHIRIGVYEQEIAPTYLDLPLAQAIEQMYLDRGLKVNDTKIRQLMSDYLFVESDGSVPLSSLSGGQKARFQLISMLANEPQLLILDEPTNHLDLPSIEELELALERYSGAILYVSHDDYFRRKIGGVIVQIGEAS
ncbi:putative ABC transporter ATP-binding protein YheS [Candidatus Nanosynsacchari sp. TM7_G1_3_12Alb]|nr:putative ABC transporter ATP-binding protein YheS [Candidatus Nanosynsacchari sp. TM7_G1_3_12Alb]